jgi:hypothetical protein
MSTRVFEAIQLEKPNRGSDDGLVSAPNGAAYGLRLSRSERDERCHRKNSNPVHETSAIISFIIPGLRPSGQECCHGRELMRKDTIERAACALLSIPRARRALGY